VIGNGIEASFIFRCIVLSFRRYFISKFSMVVSEPLLMSDLLVLEVGVFAKLSGEAE
jgi:hypothetical protein